MHAAVVFFRVDGCCVTSLLRACSHMPYPTWAELDDDSSGFRIVCDKSQGREASGDARGAGLRAEARAATRRLGSNPRRSTSLMNPR